MGRGAGERGGMGGRPRAARLAGAPLPADGPTRLPGPRAGHVAPAARAPTGVRATAAAGAPPRCVRSCARRSLRRPPHARGAGARAVDRVCGRDHGVGGMERTRGGGAADACGDRAPGCAVIAAAIGHRATERDDRRPQPAGRSAGADPRAGEPRGRVPGDRRPGLALAHARRPGRPGLLVAHARRASAGPETVAWPGGGNAAAGGVGGIRE